MESPNIMKIKGDKTFFEFDMDDLKDTYFEKYHNFTGGDIIHEDPILHCNDFVLEIYQDLINKRKSWYQHEKDAVIAEKLRTQQFGIVDQICSFIHYIGHSEIMYHMCSVVYAYYYKYYQELPIATFDFDFAREKIRFYSQFDDEEDDYLASYNFVQAVGNTYIRSLVVFRRIDDLVTLHNNILTLEDGSIKTLFYNMLMSSCFITYNFDRMNNGSSINYDNLIRIISLDKVSQIFSECCSIRFLYQYSKIHSLPLNNIFEMVDVKLLEVNITNELSYFTITQLFEIYSGLSNEMKEIVDKFYKSKMRGY